MSLFQNSVVTKHLQSQDKIKLIAQWNVFKNHFQNPIIQDNIRNSKEEEYQGEFLIDLFVSVFGYTKKPLENFNLVSEKRNVKDSKKADGAIVINEQVKAVIELKGTNTTDLGKIEVQAFGYKNNQPDCVYVITSNFEKLRFYIDNATEFIEFNLFHLSEMEFELLYLCLAYENIAHDVPKKLKEQSLSKEKDITKALYSDYSLFKRELHQDLVIQNPGFDALELFKKSQKLLDRFLFLFFAEDRHLLPPNSVQLILNDWRDLQERDEVVPLYSRFKKYFEYLNTGFKGKRYDVFAYNGGLFKPDEVLDSITIDDELLYRHTLKLSEYNFASEVDVNILGHIFENSLNELDEIKAQLEGRIIEKATTKRKKDGVFYTPKYITKYIVDNTIGKLCIDKKAELRIDEEDYIFIKTIKTKLKRGDKAFPNEKKESLADNLLIYRNWLLQITICDPACGSGAFLNQALDFLIQEHRYIDELQAKLFGDALVLSDVEKSILENNLFGVDLNEESVEIAKLSLWLRTAQPYRKLNDLNNNIQCGNSLIDDPEIAGEKAFNWQTAFPTIFDKGGFDVIIGNPPYGILIDKETQIYYSQHFPLTQYKTNLYVLFIERMLQVFETGVVFFIIPKSLLFNSYYELIRKELIHKTELNEIFTITEKVFEDAEVGGSLLLKFTIKKSINLNNIVKLGSAEKVQNFILGVGIVENMIAQNSFLNIPNSEISIISSNSQFIVEKLNKLKTIGNFYTLKNGLNPGNIKHILISDLKDTEKHRPIIWGKDISKYIISWSGQFINYDETIGNRINLEDIKSKDGMNKQNKIDFALRSPKLFDSRKIIIRKTGDSLIGSIDELNFCYDTLAHGIYEETENFSLEFLLAILNSKPATIFYRLLHDIKGKVFAKISLDNLSSFPIPECSLEEKMRLEENTKTLNHSVKDLQEQSQKFQRALQRKFELEDLPKKLQDWYLLCYKDFIKELSKKKITLSLSQEAEWEDYFVTESKKVNEIKSQINAIDKEIDRMVYRLYGLSKEEIEIVEKV